MEHLDAFVIFAKAGELGSISAAARALGLPKVRVSRAVSGLEAVCNVKRIDRTTQRVTLTEVGRPLHVRCLRMREEVEEADAEVATHRGDPAGTLRIDIATSDVRVSSTLTALSLSNGLRAKLAPTSRQARSRSIWFNTDPVEVGTEAVAQSRAVHRHRPASP